MAESTLGVSFTRISHSSIGMLQKVVSFVFLLTSKGFNFCPFLDSIIEIEHSDSVHDKMADIYAIGFQEIVDLNAQNIMAASSDNAKACK